MLLYFLLLKLVELRLVIQLVKPDSFLLLPFDFSSLLVPGTLLLELLDSVELPSFPVLLLPLLVLEFPLDTDVFSLSLPVIPVKKMLEFFLNHVFLLFELFKVLDSE